MHIKEGERLGLLNEQITSDAWEARLTGASATPRYGRRQRVIDTFILLVSLVSLWI